MRVLFLDVDGVLNSRANMALSRGMMGMAAPHVSELRRIVRETGCKIVVSSTWRFGGIEEGSSFHRALSLHEGGDEILAAVIDRTVDGWILWGRSDGHVRADEIGYWLDSLDEDEDVQSYAIVDDDEIGRFGPNVFRTSFDTGLTAEIADRIIGHLCPGRER